MSRDWADDLSASVLDCARLIRDDAEARYYLAQLFRNARLQGEHMGGMRAAALTHAANEKQPERGVNVVDLRQEPVEPPCA